MNNLTIPDGGREQDLVPDIFLVIHYLCVYQYVESYSLTLVAKILQGVGKRIIQAK